MIRIITQCTKEKKWMRSDELDLNDFRDTANLLEKKAALAAYREKAEDMYAGMHHQFVMNGLQRFRSAFPRLSDLYIVSAGYGLLRGNDIIEPYNVTFTGLKSRVAEEWADHLRVPDAIRDVLAMPGELTIIAVGTEYLKAMKLNKNVYLGAPVLALVGDEGRKHISGRGQIRFVPAGLGQTTRFSAPTISLKGKMVELLLDNMTKWGPQYVAAMLDEHYDPLDLLDNVDHPTKTGWVFIDEGAHDQGVTALPSGSQLVGLAA